MRMFFVLVIISVAVLVPSSKSSSEGTAVIEGITLVSIPGGSFSMGSTYGENDEKPVHKVTLSAFEMGATEVTQSQFKAIMGFNPSEYKGDDMPVETVSWNDAVEFCKRLSEKTGNSFSLPTEAEWEYACRAGTTTVFYSGNNESDLARVGVYAGNLKPKNFIYEPSGQKIPNSWGLYDMHGNVFEWCNDWSSEDYYKSSPTKTPKGPTTGSARVARGGGWTHSVFSCSSAIRFSWSQTDTERDLGFRVVRRKKAD